MTLTILRDINSLDPHKAYRRYTTVNPVSRGKMWKVALLWDQGLIGVHGGRMWLTKAGLAVIAEVTSGD